MNATRSRILLEGLIAGLIGYVVVALSVAAIDVIAGRLLFETPSLLGQILVGGFGSPTPGEVSPGPVFAYNGIHLLLFVAVGMALSWAVFVVERYPVLWYGAFFAALVVVLLSFLVLSLVGQPHTDVLPVGGLIAANGFAVLAVGVYLGKSHPSLASEIMEHGDPEEAMEGQVLDEGQSVGTFDC